MIRDKKEFGLGLLLIAVFLAVLVLIFAPLHAGGRNTLDYLDSTFNSISKASAYYIPAVAAKTGAYDGVDVTVNLKAVDAAQAARMNTLLAAAGGEVAADGARLKVTADLGRVLHAVLADADLMFRNDGAAVAGKYGFDERRVLYDWHQTLAAISKDLTRQERFKEAKILREIQSKAVEPAYNYYQIEAVPMSDMIWVAVAALIGYVLYTVWYGFAVMFLFEGWGLRLKH
jgi:hypothetical protein